MLLDQLAGSIVALQRPNPVRVAIDGPDAAGKTTLADELATRIRDTGRGVIRASIDGFHRPRNERYARYGDTAEAFYRDSFNYDALLTQLLLPLGPEGSRRYRLAVFDFRSDKPRTEDERVAGENDVLLFDGVFLLRPELIDAWDYRIFLNVAFEELIRRAMERDQSLFGSPEKVRERYVRKYIPGQQLYFSEVQPQTLADVVIDNTIPDRPAILTHRSM